MSQIELVQTSTIKCGQYIVIDGKPCRVIATTQAKPGKHGASKTLFDAKDILTGKNVQTSAASKGTIEVPEIVQENYTVIDVSEEGFMTLMRNGVLRQDIRIPQGEHGDAILALLNKDKTPDITIMFVLEHTIVNAVRESRD